MERGERSESEWNGTGLTTPRIFSPWGLSPADRHAAAHAFVALLPGMTGRGLLGRMDDCGGAGPWCRHCHGPGSQFREVQGLSQIAEFEDSVGFVDHLDLLAGQGQGFVVLLDLQDAAFILKAPVLAHGADFLVAQHLLEFHLRGNLVMHIGPAGGHPAKLPVECL